MEKPTEVSAGIPTPQVNITPADNPFVQQLLRENQELKAERDQLLAVKARLERRLSIARDGIQVLADRIREERQ